MDVILTHAGSRPIDVLRLVRETFGLGLEEAKYFVENLPQTLASGCGEEEARALRRRLEEAGATVTLR